MKYSPKAFEGETDRFLTGLEAAEESRVRRDLAGAVTKLVEQQAIPLEDAGPALTEATRIRDEEHWDDRPKNELAVVRKGVIGWVELAAVGETVPGIVVKRALTAADFGHRSTLYRTIDLLQAAIESGSPETEMAFEGLVDITTADEQTIIADTTLAIANLVLSGDVPDKDTARTVITDNAAVVREEYPIIEEIPDDHPRAVEARENQQLVEQAHEKLTA
ncbi:hypothetical protein [Halocatena salina]|uniref:Uncharacterized protein n=1 Tax=Halocatena salina TaxID=2934340 RepID=A0A8U0A034_9EURY|nr:hypothetical protein [Halocatena salina]UPM42415.1 hypothetical protein MW046_10670 [Halocatena salina]